MAEPENDASAGDPAPGERALALGRGRYEMLTSEPLPAFEQPSAQAFAARPTSGAARALVALVVGAGVPARVPEADQFAGKGGHGLMTLIERTEVRGFGDGPVRRTVMLYERPAGGAVVASGVPRLGEDQIEGQFLRPLLDGLHHLHENQITHRGVRPENLFWIDGARSEMVLGDGLAGPAGFAQPTLFEPVPSAMAQPDGRGRGDPQDDFYALGACLLYLASGGRLMRGLDAKQIIAHKLARGSYNAMIGNLRISPNLCTLLRGLLADNASERWGYAEACKHLDGRQVLIPAGAAPAAAERPFDFDGGRHRTRIGLAEAMAAAPNIAAPIIRAGKLDAWMRRYFTDHQSADAVSALCRNLGASAAVSEKLVAMVTAVLDPDAPIRYRGFRVFSDGLGPALANSLARGGSGQVFAEIVNHDLAVFNIGLQQIARRKQAAAQKTHEALRNTLRLLHPGMGLERCLYDLNPGLACMGASVGGAGIVDIDDVLPALEAGCQGDAPRLNLDRHLAAFIGSRRNGSADTLLARMAEESDLGDGWLAKLQLLAPLQTLHGPDSLPALARLFAARVEPAMVSFRCKRIRARVVDRLRRLAEGGSLVKLAAAADDPTERQADASAFGAARRSFAEAESVIEQLARLSPRRRAIAEYKGRKAAAAISAALTLAGAMMVGYAMVN